MLYIVYTANALWNTLDKQQDFYIYTYTFIWDVIVRGQTAKQIESMCR